MDFNNLFLTNKVLSQWCQLSQIPLTRASARKVLLLLLNQSEYVIEDGETTYVGVPTHPAGHYMGWVIIKPMEEDDARFSHVAVTVRKHKDIVELFPEDVEELDVTLPIKIQGRFLFLYKEDPKEHDWRVITDDRGRTRFRFYDILEYVEEAIDEFNVDPL